MSSRGIMGAQVWEKVTALGEAPPTRSSDLKFLLLATRSPAILEHLGNRAGDIAHYMLRWLNRRGAPGNWSEARSATVGV